MADWAADLSADTDEIFRTEWSERSGQIVPEAEDLPLKNSAVKLNAAFLYADLAGSSRIAKVCPWETTAKIIRAYLGCATKLIRAYGGHIRSFDGDRVMGVFTGPAKEIHATKCGREIFWTTENIIAPKALSTFNSIKQNNIKVTQCVGIDAGECRAVRAGIRDNNDLIWVGKPPSLAAKLSDVRNYPNCVYISHAVYNQLTPIDKIYGASNIWTFQHLSFAGVQELVYRTSWMLKP